MILESLYNLVEDLKSRIEVHGAQLRSNEMQTRYALVDPLLRELGWDTSDPSQVTPEYSVGSGRADYALLRDGKPVLMVEAKRLGEDLQGAVLQGVSYSWQQGAGYFAVTDGQGWEIYNIRSGGRGEEPKPQVSFDIVRDPPASVCLEVLALWRSGVMGGRVRPGRPPIVAPDNAPPPPSPEESRGPEWKPLDRSSLKLDDSGRNVQPVEVSFPDSTSQPVKYWWEITASVAGWLIDSGSLTESLCPIRLGRSCRHIISARPVHSNGSAMAQPKQVKTLYMEANYSAANHVDNAKAVIAHVGHDSRQFKLRFP